VKSLWPEVGTQDWCHAFERRPNISDLETIDVGAAKN
jgi:hypothetical protein